MVALDGRRAIVTGASSGIGEATARALEEAGAHVYTGSRREGNLDVTDRESCERFVRDAIESLGGLDILVNNAGLSRGRDPVWEQTEEDEREVIETNVLGLMRITNVAGGLVETDFSKVRFHGDEEKAKAVYANVAMGGPLHASDMVDCIMFALTRPAHVNIDEIVVMALAQVSGGNVLREG